MMMDVDTSILLFRACFSLTFFAPYGITGDLFSRKPNPRFGS